MQPYTRSQSSQARQPHSNAAPSVSEYDIATERSLFTTTTAWSPSHGKITQYIPPPPPLTRTQRRAANRAAKLKHDEEVAIISKQMAALEKKIQSVRARKLAEVTASLSYSPEHPNALHPESLFSENKSRHRRRLGPVVSLLPKDPSNFDVNTPQEQVGCTECGQEVLLRTLIKHQSTECSGRFVTCRQTGCAARFREADRSHHEKHKCNVIKARRRILKDANAHNTCIECPLGCGAGITRKDLARHKLSVCTFRFVTCPHMGCDVRLRADQMLGPEGHAAKRCKINEARNRMAKSSNDRRLVPIACSPHHNMGCGKMILPKDMKRHEEVECPNRLVECRNKGCQEKVAFNLLEFHEKNLCKAFEIQQELLGQGRLEYVCDLGCGEYVLLNKMADHKRNECPYREATCSITGCGKKMPFYLIERHEQVWERKVEQASKKFYYVNPDTQETSWEDPGCRVLRKREEYLEIYESKPRKILCKLGCRTVLKNQIEAYRQHLEECPNAIVTCPSPGHICNRKMLRRKVAEHLRTDCKVGRRLIKLAKRGHAQRMVLECTQCGVEVIAREYTRHRNKECSGRMVACKYWDCKLMLPADRWMQHINGECQHSAKWRNAIAASRSRPSRKPQLPDIFRGGVSLESPDVDTDASDNES